MMMMMSYLCGMPMFGGGDGGDGGDDGDEDHDSDDKGAACGSSWL
jgi:hypothetical protein